jgi:geranylgeranyl pyrophosphate synthase
MRYSCLQGGKRSRPLLVYATASALGLQYAQVDGIACAVELIHAYSLVHDDLPAMDNADLRRGQPSCHKVFGEAQGILAGDGLQALAFHVLATDEQLAMDPNARLAMIAALSQAAGGQGMVAGQVLDLEAEGKELNLQQLAALYRLKTGALIQASVLLVALSCQLDKQPSYQQLQTYSAAIGLGFQIQDDILDITSSTATLGKPQGADLRQGKTTYLTCVGLEQSKARVQQLTTEALSALADFGSQADYLRMIAHYNLTRNH